MTQIQQTSGVKSHINITNCSDKRIDMKTCYKCKIFDIPHHKDGASIEKQINSWLEENPTINIEKIALSPPNIYKPEMVIIIFYKEI